LQDHTYVRSLDVYKGTFRSQENDEELFNPKVSYLSVIRALMYLAKYTQPNVAFAINLLSRTILYLQKDIGLE